MSGTWLGLIWGRIGAARDIEADVLKIERVKCMKCMKCTVLLGDRVGHRRGTDEMGGW